MKYVIPQTIEKYTDKQLIEDIKRVARRLKTRRLSMVDYNRLSRYSAATCARRFGGWHHAIERAGLAPVRVKDISGDELMMNLKKVWDKLGRMPRAEDMKPPLTKYSKQVYTWRFGSWRRAVELFTRYMKCRSGRKKEQLLEEAMYKRGAASARHVCKTMRYDILRRDNFKCRLCGSSPAIDPAVILHIDHILPWSKGGKTKEANLQTLCQKCNLGKGGTFN